ncbi:MAG: hypothetical protein IIY75_04680, partial [Erysipelotrichales bacterium]|nr:hypothetical protein [Erysipelotrichales bacterium]
MGQIFKKSLKVLLSVLMCFSVLTAPTVVRVVNAVDGEAPDHNKTLVPNGDGTYKLHLTVTGEADTTKTDAKANILIIYDVSGSMNYGTNYVRNNTGRYG